MNIFQVIETFMIFLNWISNIKVKLKSNFEIKILEIEIDYKKI